MRSRDFWSRVPQCMLGLVGVGLGAALMLDAGVGVAPWDVFHQGIHNHTGIPIGTISILVGFALFLLWIPLKQRPGAGTVLNVFTIGLAIDAFLAVPFEPHGLVFRVACCVVGDVVIAASGGLYIGAGLGAGPRDGLMTGLVARGYPLRTVRAAMELTVLAAGWLLGGNVGFGTVLFAVTVGPILHFVLHRVDRGVLAPQRPEVEPTFPN
ncbi:MAG: hypothetical protein H0U92_01615 [Actinobacteria bacterium]|nr:hypothetical protein [Actinomycetota bacterium]